MNATDGARSTAVTRYRPTPLALPSGTPITRTFVDPRSHRRGHPPLGADDYADYERHAIFHDVFLAGGEIRAIGPPLANLERLVRPIRCRVLQPNGSASPPLPHRLENRERCTLHRFRLPPESRHADALRASVDLATGQRAELDLRRAALEPVFLQFATLQKDSPFEWIADWLGYAARLGVERVLLYDNGSADAGTLPERLAALRLAPEVVLVHWPFAYGPAHSHYNQFAQASQLNHAHACFGGARWCGHFDLDEYPVARGGRALPELLRALPSRTGLLRIDSWWAPPIVAGGAESGERAPSADRSDGGPPRAREFGYRERKPRGKAHKYLVRGEALRAARVHNARLRFGWWRRRPPPELLAFVHFMALTTNWKGGGRAAAVAMDPERHVEERRVADVLATLATG